MECADVIFLENDDVSICHISYHVVATSSSCHVINCYVIIHVSSQLIVQVIHE
jgi:hypothetical protein